MKNACPDSNKVALIEEDCSGKADDSEADDEDADSHLLSDEEYDVDESGKA
jgi:hypothetical protein